MKKSNAKSYLMLSAGKPPDLDFLQDRGTARPAPGFAPECRRKEGRRTSAQRSPARYPQP